MPATRHLAGTLNQYAALAVLRCAGRIAADVGYVGDAYTRFEGAIQLQYTQSGATPAEIRKDSP